MDTLNGALGFAAALTVAAGVAIGLQIRRERIESRRDALADAATAAASEYIETERCPMCHGGGRITKGSFAPIRSQPDATPDLGVHERGLDA